jgi:two-component system response regulator CpxR
MHNILLADDDIDLCDLLKQYLVSESFVVDAVHDGAAAVAAMHTGAYDLMVLDVMMPEMNGLDALREVRKQSRIPVLMLTARGDDIDRIIGLELGADDYLAKPCNPRELVARIRAILRRAAPPTANAGVSDSNLVAGDVQLHPGSRVALLKGEALDLTSTEFNVLACLLENAGTVVRKEQLTEVVLERKLTRYDRSMDMHVSNLRRKLGPGANGDDRIKTVRGIGYIYARTNSR